MPVSASRVLPPKPGLEGEDVASRKLRDQSDLEGVLDGGRAADGGQEALEAGEVLKPAAELGLDGGVASADRAPRPVARGATNPASSSRQRRWRDCAREGCTRLR